MVLKSVRRRSASLAAGWLLCQAILLAAPLGAGYLAAANDLCTCPGGAPGALCPMHHHGVGVPDSSKPSSAALRNSCAPPDIALLSIASGFGVLPAPLVVVVDTTATVLPAFSSVPVQRTRIPDFPPPRA